MRFTQVTILAACLVGCTSAWSPRATTTTPRHGERFPSGVGGYKVQSSYPALRMTESTLRMTDSSETPSPTTFREAEVLGLRLMQEGNYQEALDGTYIYEYVTPNMELCSTVVHKIVSLLLLLSTFSLFVWKT